MVLQHSRKRRHPTLLPRIRSMCRRSTGGLSARLFRADRRSVWPGSARVHTMRWLHSTGAVHFPAPPRRTPVRRKPLRRSGLPVIFLTGTCRLLRLGGVTPPLLLLLHPHLQLAFGQAHMQVGTGRSLPRVMDEAAVL